MTNQAILRGSARSRAGLLVAWGAAALASACAAATPSLPEARPIIIYSGARIRADQERLETINEWVIREQANIAEDPGFWVITEPAAGEVYPWEGMSISRDSVRVRMDPRALDTKLVHDIYGHLHLMAVMGRQEEWLPEAPTATGYELERAILARASDAWLLGRTVFGTAPYEPLDELLYANEAGFLDAFIFTARPDEFAEARARWAREMPDEAERYRSWFRETFNREPPGLRPR